jgi:hypothetical protein
MGPRIGGTYPPASLGPRLGLKKEPLNSKLLLFVNGLGASRVLVEAD